MKDNSYENLGKDLLWMKKLIFAGVFIEENKLHAVYDRYNELSAKQWLLLAVMQGFDEAPDLSKLGIAMGCSRQNVKKLALQLENDGYVKLVKSDKDARSLLVVKTEKGKSMSLKMSSMANDVHNAFFSEFSDEEIITYYELSKKIMHGIDKLDEYFKKLGENKKNEEGSKSNTN